MNKQLLIKSARRVLIIYSAYKLYTGFWCKTYNYLSEISGFLTPLKQHDITFKPDIDAIIVQYDKIYGLLAQYEAMIILGFTLLMGVMTYVAHKYDRYILCTISAFYSSVVTFQFSQLLYSVFTRRLELHTHIDVIDAMKGNFFLGFLLCYALTMKSAKKKAQEVL